MGLQSVLGWWITKCGNSGLQSMLVWWITKYGKNGLQSVLAVWLQSVAKWITKCVYGNIWIGFCLNTEKYFFLEVLF